MKKDSDTSQSADLLLTKTKEQIAKIIFESRWLSKDDCEINDHWCMYSALDGTCKINGKKVVRLKRCPYDWNKALYRAEQIFAHYQPIIETQTEARMRKEIAGKFHVTNNNAPGGWVELEIRKQDWELIQSGQMPEGGWG